jgi:hypothetical protein
VAVCKVDPVIYPCCNYNVDASNRTQRNLINARDGQYQLDDNLSISPAEINFAPDPMAGKKGTKRSSTFIEEEEDEEGVQTVPVKAKKTKVADGEAASGKDDEGNPFWSVSLLILSSQKQILADTLNSFQASVGPR